MIQLVIHLLLYTILILYIGCIMTESICVYHLVYQIFLILWIKKYCITPTFIPDKVCISRRAKYSFINLFVVQTTVLNNELRRFLNGQSAIENVAQLSDSVCDLQKLSNHKQKVCILFPSLYLVYGSILIYNLQLVRSQQSGTYGEKMGKNSIEAIARKTAAISIISLPLHLFLICNIQVIHLFAVIQESTLLQKQITCSKCLIIKYFFDCVWFSVLVKFIYQAKLAIKLSDKKSEYHNYWVSTDSDMKKCAGKVTIGTRFFDAHQNKIKTLATMETSVYSFIYASTST